MPMSHEEWDQCVRLGRTSARRIELKEGPPQPPPGVADGEPVPVFVVPPGTDMRRFMADNMMCGGERLREVVPELRDGRLAPGGVARISGWDPIGEEGRSWMAFYWARPGSAEP